MKNNYRLDGEYAYIQLKRRNGEVLEAKIDIDDFNITKNHKWFADYNKPSEFYYVYDSKNKISLHRLLINPGSFKENKLMVDHINRDTLDNTRKNLRIVTNQENQFNGRYKGYYYNTHNKKWITLIRLNGKQKHIGLYNTEQEARESYLKVKEQYHIIGGNKDE